MPKTRRRTVATDRRFRRIQNGAADHGPPERWQHSGRALEFTDQAGILAARALEEHVIDTLHLRGLLDADQREAAFRFKLDYQRAGLEEHVTARYAPIVPGNNCAGHVPDRTHAEEAAYQRWRNAIRAIGKLTSDAVISAVCHDRVPTPRMMMRLQDGLRHLVLWYGIARERAQALRHNIEQASAR